MIDTRLVTCYINLARRWHSNYLTIRFLLYVCSYRCISFTVIVHSPPSFQRHIFTRKVCAIIPLSLWIVGTAFIQNPYNSFSSNVDLDQDGDGNEQIEYANLFFFSWIVLFSNTFLVGAIFRDYGSYDPQISGWLILMVSSVVLMGMAATLRTDICAMNAQVVCQRTDFAIAIGAMVGVLSCIAIVLVACSKMGAVSYLLISFISSGMFIFGVSKFLVDYCGLLFSLSCFVAW